MVTKWSQNYRADVRRLEKAKQLTSSRSKVFIAIHLEWDETNPEKIFEIGLAVLDLRMGRLHPNRFPPSTWSIRPRHIIVTENRKIHNSKYTRSNKFGFKFGRSYHARETKAMDTVQYMLNKYDPEDLVIVGHLMPNDLTRLEDWGV